MFDQIDLDRTNDAIREAAPAWGIHLTPARWPRSKDRVFLADAAKQLGEAMFLEWNGEELGWMILGRQHPLIPEASEAFVGEVPIERVHEVFGDSVRQILSVPSYQRLELLRAPVEEWIANLIPDPDGGEPIIAPDLRIRRGEGASNPITRDHWDKAFWHAEVGRGEFNGSRRYVPLIADKLVELAQSDVLATYARPYGGGEAIALPASAWEIDDGMLRLATCAINPGHPFDPAVEPTHFIFVEAEGLAAALAEVEQVCLVDTSDIADGQPAGDQDDLHGNVLPFRSTGAAEVECRQWLVEQFGNSDTSRQIKEMFKAEALKRSGGRLSGKGFARAWDAAVSQFPERGRPGPRGS